jgi:hypothetical protein
MRNITLRDILNAVKNDAAIKARFLEVYPALTADVTAFVAAPSGQTVGNIIKTLSADPVKLAAQASTIMGEEVAIITPAVLVGTMVEINAADYQSHVLGLQKAGAQYGTKLRLYFW